MLEEHNYNLKWEDFNFGGKEVLQRIHNEVGFCDVTITESFSD